jgi:hypothetical protein
VCNIYKRAATTPTRPTNPPLTTFAPAPLFAVVEADAEAATAPLVVLLATLTAPLEPEAVVAALTGALYAEETAREMAELVVVV